MEISGKKLQEELLPQLKRRLENLKSRGVNPAIGIVTLGPEETWEAYVGQKIKLAKSLGITTKLLNLRPKTTDDVLRDVKTLNSDNTIHGLIVQRPFPTYIDTDKVIQSISKEKDIDGFRNDSPYQVPVWLAVQHFLTHVSQLLGELDFQFWLSQRTVLVIGKGQTAGRPVIKELQNLKIKTLVMDSKTIDRNNLFRSADIIIFATGKRMEIPYKMLKKTCILIGIGLHRFEGKLQGDFDEFEAKNSVLYYTPSPGGVGPLNLAFLFENLLTAAENSTKRGV
ncbi:MAG: bifunctional 5,10-methylenetetrahydrofolate dehydrogenase/5,10-methenyltetrahydrofolate cyclohydrolase [Candidatus Levybacteria bacterium]|nr:bifunctional 5,10-methylenetetrahydrofolate dehydrogenase/5,10-methenyltetrahydrofolate cyclohydrolase [Candidatus Levybacteria bacterium]